LPRTPTSQSRHSMHSAQFVRTSSLSTLCSLLDCRKQFTLRLTYPIPRCRIGRASYTGGRSGNHSFRVHDRSVSKRTVEGKEELIYALRAQFLNFTLSLSRYSCGRKVVLFFILNFLQFFSVFISMSIFLRPAIYTVFSQTQVKIWTLEQHYPMLFSTHHVLLKRCCRSYMGCLWVNRLQTLKR
jgi:hypothetical protein